MPGIQALKMNYLFSLASKAIKIFLFIALTSVAQLNAQPATYQNEIFTIPQGAVLDPDNPSFYNNIQFRDNGDGSFQLVDAQNAALVTVDDIVINIMESFPVQISVTVSGYKSVPCVDLQTAAVGMQGNQFIVVLAETTLGPAESCIAIIDPFETSVSLDVEGLEAGTYTVNVNGTLDEFTLDVDN